MKVSIIIPFINAFEYTKNCLFSIKECTPEIDYEIILVDNGSNESNDDFYSYAKGCATLIRNEENEGFPKAINQGIFASKGDFICILNNDTVVSPGWMEHLLFHLEKDYIDIVGPCTNSISGTQQVYFKAYYNKEDFYSKANLFYEERKGKYEPLHRLVGFCLVMKRKVIDAVGCFDEIFTPGNFEDDDFCMRAIDRGFHCVVAQDVFIHHFGSVTHQQLSLDYANLLDMNKKLFDRNWPQGRYLDMIVKNRMIPKWE